MMVRNLFFLFLKFMRILHGKFFMAFEALKIRLNYRRVLKRIKHKKGKIRVIFLVNQETKWKYQALFDELKKTDSFEPLVSLTYCDDEDKFDVMSSFEAKRDYFYSHNINSSIVYDITGNRRLSLESLQPDVVFYQQPWEYQAPQDPQSVSQYALTCYIPYFLQVADEDFFSCQLKFHRSLWRYFVLNRFWKKFYQRHISFLSYAGKIVESGYPMLDNFNEYQVNSPKDGYVIYAPHFAFPHKKNVSYSECGTFLWNGIEILKYAQKNPQIKWVFKPHPRLKTTLIDSGIMNELQVKEYYNAWLEIGECCLSSDYMSYFQKSSALITDSLSFLLEYPASISSPVIWLKNVRKKTKKRGIPTLNKVLFDTYYQVYTVESMIKIFDNVLIKRIDHRKDERINAIKNLGLLKRNSSERIVLYLKKCFNIK